MTLRFHSLSSLSILLVFAWAVLAASGGEKIRVALYGTNGHQLSPAKLADHPHATLIAVAAYSRELPAGAKVTTHPDLDALLADPSVDLVSLCSPRRADQARDAIRCLTAGKHVYAEKPCALSERELDDILAVAAKSGREFHEMAGTVFAQPYFEMRRAVRAGEIGEVVQVLVQKSYPYGTHRPQDEGLDGGLFLQAGIHAARLVEHVTGQQIRDISGLETATGLPESGEGKMAAGAQMTLENGAIATIIMNYLNPAGNKPRNNETLRVFGVKGFTESIDDGTRTRLVTAERTIEPLDLSVPSADYFDLIAAHLADGKPLPLSTEEELHPLRMLLRAKEKLRASK
jgi:predicted dehydrogenase